MVTNQKHSSDSIASKRKVFRYEKIANRIADMHSALSEKMGALDGKMDNYYSEYKKSVKRLERDVRSLKIELEDYYSQHNTLEKRVKKLERNIKSLETKLEDLDKCVDRETVVDIIHEIVPLLIGKKGKSFSYLSESSKESDLVKTFIIREGKAVPYKQQRKGSQRDQA